MSSPDDDERSDDFPNSDYAPKWTRDRYRQGSPDTAKDEPPPSFLRRSLDPEIVHLPQHARSLGPSCLLLTLSGHDQPILLRCETQLTREEDRYHRGAFGSLVSHGIAPRHVEHRPAERARHARDSKSPRGGKRDEHATWH
jgi:hypothetical protein